LTSVLEGQIAPTVAGVTRTYRPGDVFTMPAGCRHIEDIGTDGGRYLMGKRRATAA
jgi:quercetin dioxygenase-like cupin family protein